MYWAEVIPSPYSTSQSSPYLVVPLVFLTTALVRGVADFGPLLPGLVGFLVTFLRAFWAFGGLLSLPVCR